MRFLNDQYIVIVNWCSDNAGVRGIDWVVVGKNRFFFDIDIHDDRVKLIFKLKFSNKEFRLVSRRTVIYDSSNN